MRSMGKVVNFSPSGSIVVKGSFAPGVGTFAVDKRSTPVGKVVRITGPVDAPYLIIKPVGEYPGGFMRMLGQPVFVGQDDNRRPRGTDKRPYRSAGRQGGRRPGADRGPGRSTGGKPDGRKDRKRGPRPGPRKN